MSYLTSRQAAAAKGPRRTKYSNLPLGPERPERSTDPSVLIGKIRTGPSGEISVRVQKLDSDREYDYYRVALPGKQWLEPPVAVFKFRRDKSEGTNLSVPGVPTHSLKIAEGSGSATYQVELMSAEKGRFNMSDFPIEGLIESYSPEEIESLKLSKEGVITTKERKEDEDEYERTRARTRGVPQASSQYQASTGFASSLGAFSTRHRQAPASSSSSSGIPRVIPTLEAEKGEDEDEKAQNFLLRFKITGRPTYKGWMAANENTGLVDPLTLQDIKKAANLLGHDRPGGGGKYRKTRKGKGKNRSTRKSSRRRRV